MLNGHVLLSEGEKCSMINFPYEATQSLAQFSRHASCILLHVEAAAHRQIPNMITTFVDEFS